MHRPPPRDPLEPLALHAWREHALALMLRLVVIVPLPLIALNLFRMLWQGIYLQIAVHILVYTAAVFLSLSRRIPYQWRTTYLLGISLSFSSYLLMQSGLISAGRVYLLAAIFIAALMLSRRATLLVWMIGAAALILSSISFVGRPAAEIAALALRLSDPYILLINGTNTLMLGAMAAIGATSLVSSLARSLHTTEQALAERDQINAELEQRVAARTHELEQTLVALQTSEAKYKTLFQVLPVGVVVVDDQGQYIEHNQIARNLLVLESPDGYARQASELTPRMVGHDGSPLSLSAYPSVRVIRERAPITGLELGIIQAEAAAQVTWVSTNVAPLEQAPYGAVIAFSDITAYKRVQAELSLQLRYAEALAHCSQQLLRQTEGADEWRASLEAALTILRETVDVSRVYIFQARYDVHGQLALHVIADSHAPGLRPTLSPRPSNSWMRLRQCSRRSPQANHSAGRCRGSSPITRTSNNRSTRMGFRPS